jgi:hypothetical protein
VAEFADVLRRRQDDPVAPFPVARLINDEHAVGVRPQARVRPPHLQAPPVQLLLVPRGIEQEMVQPLPVGPRYE